jgi:hypothetical protein
MEMGPHTPLKPSGKFRKPPAIFGQQKNKNKKQKTKNKKNLERRCVLKISSRKAVQFLKRNNYQGARKLQINERLARLTKLSQGNIPLNGE